MTREEADKLIAAIEAQVDKPKEEEPKWVPQKGELCEFADDDWGDDPLIARFHSMCGVKFSASLNEKVGSRWIKCRKLHTKATKQKHDGSDKCPVDSDAWVRVHYVCQTWGFDVASRVKWINVEYYWELEK